MKLSALMLSAVLIGAAGLSGNATAHGNDWRGYAWDDRRGHSSERHHRRHAQHHRGHHYRWHRPQRWSRHHRYDRHDHDDVWYGLHLFLGGH